jgi:hypothetical protein
MGIFSRRDKEGHDDGYDQNGYDKNGFDKDGVPKLVGSPV